MLPRSNRLRSNRDFELVLRRGRRYGGAYFNLWIFPGEQAFTQIGITTSRKVGNAVRRNRYRRLLRESLRSVLPKVASGYKIVVVVRARSSDDQRVPALGELHVEMIRLLKAGGALIGAE